MVEVECPRHDDGDTTAKELGSWTRETSVTNGEPYLQPQQDASDLLSSCGICMP